MLTFDHSARLEIGQAFAQVLQDKQYTCYACAIMPDHVHILIRKHKHLAEEMIQHLKAASRQRLYETNHRPADHRIWTGGGGWKVFLDHPDEVIRTIDYIEQNPIQIGLPPQRWAFVQTYDGWPFHRAYVRI